MNSFESELIRDGTTQFPTRDKVQLHLESSFSTSNLNQSLDLSFLEPKEQTKVDKARQILGESTKNILTEQLEIYITQLELLTNSWLDSYEKQLFDGKTLQEITKLDST